MDALISIYEFGDLDIASHTDEHICVVSGHPLSGYQKIGNYALDYAT